MTIKLFNMISILNYVLIFVNNYITILSCEWSVIQQSKVTITYSSSVSLKTTMRLETILYIKSYFRY